MKPPARFMGWRVVGASAVAQGVAIGFTIGTFGIFLEPMERAFGASRASVSWGLAGMNLGMNLLMPVVGRAMDRGSIRRIMGIGVVLNALAFLWVARAIQLWEMLAAFTLLASLGTAMFGPLASSTLVANWFNLKRGKALGIVNIGAPIGVMLAAPLASWGVIALGWRETLIVFALTTLIVALPASWLLVISRPSEVGQAPDGTFERDVDAQPTPASVGSGLGFGQILARPSFWVIAISCGIPIAASIVLTGHLVAYAAGLGVGPQPASVLVSVQAGAAIAGTLVFGSLADRLPVRLLLLGSIAAQASMLGVLVVEPGYPVLLAAVVITGVCFGGTMPLCGALIGAHFGASVFGQILGLVNVVALPLAVAGPPAAGAIYDATGSYQLAFVILIALYVLAGGALAFQPAKQSRSVRATPAA